MTFFEKGSLQSIKNQNKKAILKCIRQYAPISRAEIAQKVNISKPTVSAIVQELIADQWVHEGGVDEAQKKGGRKPINIQFNNQAAYIIGVDIGGTNVMVGLTNLDGHIIASKSFETNQFVHTGILKEIKIVIEKLLDQHNIERRKVLGMGIGVPGMTDTHKGIVIDAPSLGWKDLNLKEEAQSIFKLPVFIDNDVNVSVLGEQWLGAAQNKSNILLISVGTGVGCGIILNGKLYRGANWAAGEIGYMITDKNEAREDIKTPFSGYGFLDSHVGGAIISRQMQEIVSNHPEHELFNKGNITAKDVFECAIKGDDLSSQVINEALEHLSFAIINAITLFNPEIVLLGGGISKSGQWFMARVKDTVNKYIPYKTEISLTHLGDYLGVIGAVSLFIREYESVLNL